MIKIAITGPVALPIVTNDGFFRRGNMLAPMLEEYGIKIVDDPNAADFEVRNGVGLAAPDLPTLPPSRIIVVDGEPPQPEYLLPYYNQHGFAGVVSPANLTACGHDGLSYHRMVHGKLPPLKFRPKILQLSTFRRGTYGEGLLHEVAEDSRIHATFNQTVARTGRLSSDRPNLHNIPVRSDEGRVFRTAFVPVARHRTARRRLQPDRTALHRPPRRRSRVSSRRSPRARTSTTPPPRRVFDVDPGDVTLDQRSKAKMVSYGLAYGMEAFGLGSTAGHPHRRSGRHPRRVLRGVPQREGVHGRHRAGGPQERIHRDAVRAAAPHPRAAQFELADPPGGGAAGDERRHPGSRRRHLQGCARPHRRGAGGGRRSRVRTRPPGARRGDRRGARRRARRRRRPGHRPDARRRRTRRAARGERRLGRARGPPPRADPTHRRP